MKKFILMTLVTATALSPVSAFAADIDPTSMNVASAFDDAAAFQREDRRAERQAERAERTPEQRMERRAERQDNRPERDRRAEPDVIMTATVMATWIASGTGTVTEISTVIGTGTATDV